MNDVPTFIDQFEEDQREVMLFLHRWLTVDLNLTDKIRFKIPFYYGQSWICYMNPTKNQTIEFAFVRGNELSSDFGILDHKGRKQVCSIELKSLKDLPKDILNEVLQEAILLDETKPYSIKKN